MKAAFLAALVALTLAGCASKPAPNVRCVIDSEDGTQTVVPCP